MKAAKPEAVPIAGGTDLMVEINLDHRRPAAIIDLTQIKACIMLPWDSTLHRRRWAR